MRRFLTLLILVASVAVVYFTLSTDSGTENAEIMPTVIKSESAEPSNIREARLVLPRDNPSIDNSTIGDSARGDAEGDEKVQSGNQNDAISVKADAGNDDLILINVFNQLKDAHIPSDLVNLYEKKNRSFQLARSDIELRERAYIAADAMFAAARKDGVEGFIITSGYRSREKQQELWDARTDDTVVKPGASEHETGLAFDVTAMESEKGFETTPQFAWLSKHSYEYGFILRYPQGKEDITGVPYEPWHYRYVGSDAREIYESGLTLEEYLN